MRSAIVLALLIAGVGAAYFRSIDGPWIFDDGWVRDDPAFRIESLSPSELKRAAAGPENEPWRWITNVSFAVNFRLFGEGTRSFHLVNVLIHCLAVLAAWLLFREILRLTGASARARERVPLIAAGLFALSPIQTQAVSYIWQRATCLAGLFALLSVWLFVRALRTDGTTRTRALAGAVLLFPVAALAKQNALMVPAAWILALVAFRPPTTRQGRLALAAAGVLLAVVFAAWLMPATIDRYEIRDFTMGERLLTQPRVVLRLLGLTLLPLPALMNIDHHVPVSTALNSPATTALAIAVLGLLVWLGLFALRRRPVVGFGVLWFLLMLVPESTVVPLEMMFEHRAYLPLAGLALALAIGIARAPGWVPATLLLLLAFFTWQRNEVWTSRVLMWEDAVAKSPMKARPHFNLALARRATGADWTVVHDGYRRAVELAPERPLYREALGRHLIVSGGSPDHQHAYVSLLKSEGRYAEAEELLRRLIAERPRDAGLRLQLVKVCVRSGGRDEAIDELEEMIRLGLPLGRALVTDGELFPLWSEPRFQALRDR